MPESESSSRSRRIFIVAALLSCVAGLSLSSESIAALFASDGKVNRAWLRAAITTGQYALVGIGLVLFFARGALAGLRVASPLGVVLALGAGGAALIGTVGSVRAAMPKPWERAGLTMPERLALLSVAKEGFYGPTPEERRRDVEDARGEEKLEAQYLLGNSLLIRGHYPQAAEEFLRALELCRTTPPPADPGKLAMRRDLENQTRKELSGAYLRWGETDNCIERNNCDSCIFPVKDGGVHQVPTGSQLALDVLRQLYEEDPEDLTSKWLYNVAAMTLGQYPDQVPPHLLAPPELFASEHPMPRFPDRAKAVGIHDDRMAGGVITEDFDLDGDVDVMSSSMGLRECDGLKYFRNEGNGSFRDCTVEAGLTGLCAGLSISQGDYDNDGDADVSAVRGAWMAAYGTLPMSLLRNNRDGTFTDVTEAAGLMTFFPGQVAEWADYDNDGWVDLFVGHESTWKQRSPSHLFHNERDGTFTDVLDESGLTRFGFVKGAAWGDFDDDGWIDLFVSRRSEASSLYRNVAGSGGRRRFEDVSEAAGIRGDLRSFAAWFFDYDNDGDLDLWNSGYGRNLGVREEDPYREPVTEIGPVLLQSGKDIGSVHSRLFRNDGGGKFTDVAKELGLHRVVLVMGSNFGDLDMDGWLDLYLGTGNPSFRALIPNKAFRNDRGRRFQDVTSATGLGHLQKGHAIAFADFDNDGDEDIFADMGGFFTNDNFANALYENPAAGHRWLTLRLHGTQTNRRAIGARLRVAIRTPEGPRTLHRMVGCASSFGASSVQQEIGLGDATGTATVTIDWPVSRTTQTFTDVPLDRVVDLTEGDPKPRIAEARPFQLKTEAAACCPPEEHEPAR